MECLAGNDGGNLGAESHRHKVLMHNKAASGIGDRLEDGCLVPWCNRSEVNQFNGIAERCQRLVAAVNERAPRDDGKRAPCVATFALPNSSRKSSPG